MFRLIGIQEVIKNLLRLSKSHLKGEMGKLNLQMAYRNFLKEAQPLVPKHEVDSVGLFSDISDIEPFLHAFKEDSILDDFEEVFGPQEKNFLSDSISRIKLALELMKNINPQYSSVIELVIHTIFTAPSKFAGGGSTSAAIGCIWIDSRPHWNDNDLLEFLIHETTHNLVFLDELCYVHYSSYPEIAKKENFAWSAILNKPRPLDKVFHSILVSTEVLIFREEHLGHPEKPHLHPPSDILLSQTLRSIDYLEENPYLSELFTERAKTLLFSCSQLLDPLKERIGGTLSGV